MANQLDLDLGSACIAARQPERAAVAAAPRPGVGHMTYGFARIIARGTMVQAPHMRTLFSSLLICVVVACGGGGSTPDAAINAHDAPIGTHDAPVVVDGPSTDSPVAGDAGVDAAPLVGIAAVRASADGAINVAIAGVLVTYVAPAIGVDAAGVFVQTNASGPALFLAVDPTTLTPAPQVGQNVTFTATMKATQDGSPRASAITGWTVNSSGNPVTGLVQDISAATDVVTAVDSYDSELITATGTVVGAFANSAANHVAAELDTAGVTGNASLKFRLPVAVRAAIDVTGGCVVKVGPTPLWRFTTFAEATAWVASDVTIMSCPAPKVTTAVAAAATSLIVSFDRLVDPASVTADGSQFTFDQGMTASAATVNGNTVTLTTSAQATVMYTLTVATTVKDTRGSTLDATAHTAMFPGFSMPATLIINEVDPNVTAGKDLVELLAVTGGNILNFRLQQDVAGAITLATLPNLTVAAGDLVVVHLAPGTSTNETTTKGDCVDVACYPNAWDVNGGVTGITFTNRVLRLIAPNNAVADAVAFAKATTASPATFPADLQTIQAAGQWLPANCGGAACTYASTPTASDATISVDWTMAATAPTGTNVSVQRKSGQVTKTTADWTQTAQTFGAPNL